MCGVEDVVVVDDKPLRLLWGLIRAPPVGSQPLHLRAYATGRGAGSSDDGGYLLSVDPQVEFRAPPPFNTRQLPADLTSPPPSSTPTWRTTPPSTPSTWTTTPSSTPSPDPAAWRAVHLVNDLKDEVDNLNCRGSAGRSATPRAGGLCPSLTIPRTRWTTPLPQLLRQLASTNYLGRQICRRGGSTFYIVNPSRPVHFLPEVIVSSDQLAIR